MYCKSCGIKISDQSKFCPFCGAAQQLNLGDQSTVISAAESVRASMPMKRSKGKKKSLLIAGVIVVLLGALGVAAMKILPLNQNYMETASEPKPTEPLVVALEETGQTHNLVPDSFVDAQVGDTVIFGKYEQDGNTANGAEDIEWMVLDRCDNVLFLLSRYGLDAKPYNSADGDVGWTTSSIRGWLNSQFYNSAFESAEKRVILPTSVRTPGEDEVIDSVFLLSLTEVESYFFSETGRKVSATDYAKSNGVYVNEQNGDTYWWLRTPGTSEGCVAYIYTWGEVNRQGKSMEASDGAVRPALRVDISLDSSNVLQLKETVPLDQAEQGDYVCLGSYEQDGNSDNGKEDVEWLVLDKQDDMILVLSRYCLDSRPYHTEQEGVVWADSSIRQWLNESFLNSAFSSEEQAKICSVSLVDGKSTTTEISTVSNAYDRIFLLSVDEVKDYLPEVSLRPAEPTMNARENGVNYNYITRTSWWWLRTAAEDQTHMMFIYASGEVESDSGNSISESVGGVRPAMWVKVS